MKTLTGNRKLWILRIRFMIVLTFILSHLILFGQVPQGFNYQAVVRDGTGQVLANQSVKVKIGILQDSETGSLIWEEEHQTVTNDFGLVNLMVGDSGATVTGGTVTTFDQINWSAGNFYLHMQIDLQDGNGYQDLGAAQLLSVPFAMFAQSGNQGPKGDPGPQGSQGPTGIQGPKGDPGDPASDDQTLVLSGKDLSITDGTTTILNTVSLNVDDADADPGNEIQDLQLNGSLLSLTMKGSPTVIDLSAYIDDADADSTNEIQDLQLSGNLLTITKNGSATAIDLSPYLDNMNYWVKSGNDITYDGGKVVIGTPAGNTQLEIIDAFQPGGKNLLVGDDAYLTDVDMINTLGVYGTTDSTSGNIKLGSNGALLSGVNGNLGIGTVLPGGKLEVQGDASEPPEKPLFEVKRHDGQTVFAVYNDSIRMYVNASPEVKGAKGGFAIGGFGAAKGSFQDYLQVTPDSVRVYIDQTPGKGSKGGFAIGGFGAVKGGTTDLMHLDKDNYFIGHQSGEKNSTGLYNQFFGYQSGMNNSAGSSNIFMGYQSGFENVSGNNNVFIGNSSGYNNIGNFNTFLGYYAGYSLTNTSNNLIMGYQAGKQAAGGSYNVILGSNAGYLNNGNYNIFIGYESGYNNIGGTDSRYSKWNTFIGYQAGKGNTTGWHNLCIGYLAGLSNQTATNQFFIGNEAGKSLTDGSNNTFVGHLSGMNSTSCYENTFIGYQSGYNNLTGHGNTYIGSAAGINATGSGNVFIGNRVGWSETGDNKLYIDNYSTTTPLIWGDFSLDRVVINGNASDNTNDRTFFVNGSAGGTGSWNTDSDLRLKKDIHTIPDALKKVMNLRGVNFVWRNNKNHETGLQMGFIAQEVLNFIPEVVKSSGQYMSMQYAPVTALLVEAIKEQQKIIESQGKEIDKLKNEKSEIAALKQQIEELRQMMGIARK